MTPRNVSSRLASALVAASTLVSLAVTSSVHAESPADDAPASEADVETGEPIAEPADAAGNDPEPDPEPPIVVDEDPQPDTPAVVEPTTEPSPEPTVEPSGGGIGGAGTIGTVVVDADSGVVVSPEIVPESDGAIRIETVANGVLDIGAIPVDTGVSNGSIVITEIMYNPSAVYDSRGEWFELQNMSQVPVDLSGWTIGDETYDVHTIDGLVIAPGASAVLARFGEFGRNGGVEADYVYGDAILLINTGDKLIVRDPAGGEVDTVDYSGDDFPNAAGRSIALLDVSADNSVGTAWCQSTTAMPMGDLGSPGGRNQCGESTATLVITEVMNNPKASSDFTGEWFEVHNDGTTPVDMAGFTVKDNDAESFTIDSSVVVPAGGYAVIGVTTEPAHNGDAGVVYAYGDQMRLYNSFDELVIVDDLGVQVDSIRWDDGRTFPDPNGASMHLLGSGLDNADGANWCESARRWAGSDFGSPGEAGSCEPEPLPSVVITEVMFDPEMTASERRGEWFELTNVGTEPAVLDGFVLRTNSTSHTIDALTIAPGARALLGTLDDAAANGNIVIDYAYGFDVPLYNTSSTLVVEAPDGTELDRVIWATNRGFPNESGHSMELRDTAVDNSLGANWCSTIDRYGDGDFGTPGFAGDCKIAPTPGLAQISEVMRNPAAVYDSRGEWFEIHNPTGVDIDLFNWSIGDDGSDFHLIRESLVIPADGYITIGRQADMSLNGGVEVDYAITAGMSLTNNDDEIVITDQFGQLVERVAWSSDGLLPRPNGGSMSRTESSMDAFADPSDVSNWCTTATQYGNGDTGTPGTLNDCVPQANHAIAINEIHRDPKATPDARGEWVELHNSGDVAIDIGGWTLRDDDVDTFVFPANTVIDAGGFLVAGRNTEDLNGGIAIDVQYGVEFIHFNTSDEIILLDTDLSPVDRVAWTAENGFPKISGAAMALIDTSLDNAVGSSWCAAVTDQGNGDFGTPGARNICELPAEPNPTLPTGITHSIFTTGDGMCGTGTTINGNKIKVRNQVRANGNIIVQGTKVDLDGRVSHGGTAALGWKANTPAGVFHEPDAQAVPYGWIMADFAPGGAEAIAAGDLYTFHDGDWNTGPSSVTAGIHFVDGNVQISETQVKLNEVTIVATGKIQVNATKIDLRPFAGDLPVLMSGVEGCIDTGIQLSGTNVDWQGSLFAPTAHVQLNATVLGAKDGGLVGASAQLSATKIDLKLG